MSDTVIKVENLSKQYRIGAKEGYRTFRETLVDAAKAPIQGIQKLFNSKSKIQNPKFETIWALKDVSFEVKRGEVVGIIGRNGAGKSTLLKILSKITEPTEGRIELRGRVGSLLEVGTGFHPELTGHENIYLYGAILGMDRWEVSRKFDEIVAFAELEKFIDTPVKRYSSGMYMRLAFAVAAHLEPDILLVDEVLAVGDAAFQKKCLGKMDTVSKEGRTVLFVSHNMAAIRKLCHTGLLLASGKIEEAGSVSKCVGTYLSGKSQHSKMIMEHISRADDSIIIDSILINDSPYDHLEISDDANEIKIQIRGRISRSIRIELEAWIYDFYDNPLAFYSPGHERGFAPEYPAGSFCISRCILLPRIMKGQYFISLSLTTPDIYGWVDIPNAATIYAEGSITSTGRVFDYNEGRGWIFLSGHLDKECDD